MGHFVLYKKDGVLPLEEGKDVEEVRLAVVATDLEGEEEERVRKSVAQKAAKNLIYKTGTVNALPRPVGAPSPSPSKFQNPPELVCFLSLLELAGEQLDTTLEESEEGGGEDASSPPLPPSREYYICLLCDADSEHTLSLFHNEMKNFGDTLIPILQKYSQEGEEAALGEEITRIASGWYWKCIEYITRCVRLIDTHLDSVIHAVLLGRNVVIVAPPPIFDDLTKLLHDVSIINMAAPLQNSPVRDDEEEQGAGRADEGQGKLVIMCAQPAEANAATLNYNDVQVTLSGKETNPFCSAWADKLRHAPSDPFKLRTLLEEFKLRVIQELNFIRKIIDQAKLSNHLMYKSYLVLRSNNNCDVLLNLLTKDVTNDVVTTEVLEVISEYIHQETAVEQ